MIMTMVMVMMAQLDDNVDKNDDDAVDVEVMAKMMIAGPSVASSKQLK